MEQGDRERRRVEVDVLQSIFGAGTIEARGDTVVVVEPADWEHGGRKAEVRIIFALAEGYPSTEKVTCRVSCRSLRPEKAAQLDRAGQAAAEQSIVGEESIFAIAETIRENWIDLISAEEIETDTSVEENNELCPSPAQQDVLGRRLLYSHHIIGKEKRAAIKEWASELGISAYVKIGWPGLIVVEGEESAVQEYTSRLMRLRWKHFGVRCEESFPLKRGLSVNQACALPRGYIELGENEMDVLAQICRDAGLEALFRTAIK